MQVTAITHKRKPVFVSIISQVTPSESSVIKKVAYEPMFLSHLRDHLGIKGIRAVSLHEPLSNVRPVIFLQYAQGAPRTEVWRGIHGASGLRADCGKIVVAVSDDIDPTNTDAVLWSIAYRANPVEDVHVAPHRSSGHGPKSGRRSNDSSLLIDATLKQVFPPLALPTREFMERARVIWDELGLPRADAAAAVARLYARRLGRYLGDLRAACRRRRLGEERRGNIRAAARRAHAGNAGARRWRRVRVEFAYERRPDPAHPAKAGVAVAILPQVLGLWLLGPGAGAG